MGSYQSNEIYFQVDMRLVLVLIVLSFYAMGRYEEIGVTIAWKSSHGYQRKGAKRPQIRAHIPVLGLCI